MALQTETNLDSLRGKAREAAKNHKASWLALGQYLQVIHKEKLYRNWGHLSFEAYCMKELRMKQTMASKLVRSYSFLEKEEPRLADPEQVAEEPVENLPNYESVDLLRLAQTNQKFTPGEIAQIRTAVLTKTLEPKEVRAKMKEMIENKAEERPAAEVLKARRTAVLRRLVTVLTSAKNELTNTRLVPSYLIRQMEDLASKLEDQLA